MSEYRSKLPESLALAFDRHAELLDFAARQRLLAEHKPPVPPSQRWLRRVRHHTGDLLIGWGLRLKAGTSLS